MKKLIIIWVTLFVSMNSIQAKHLFEITSNLNAVKILDENRIVIAGDCGNLLFSSDKGLNWTSVSSNTNMKLRDIYYPYNSEYVYIAGDNEVLQINLSDFKITKLNIGLENKFTSIYVDLDNNLYVGSLDGSIYKTSDLGKNWLSQKVSNQTIKKFTLFESKLFAIDLIENFYTQTDNSFKFEKSTKPINFINQYNNKYFLNENVGFEIGTGQVKKTINKGNSWEVSLIDSISNIRNNIFNLNALHFFNESFGIVVGEYNTIYITKDGGNTWDICSGFSNYLRRKINFHVFEGEKEDVLYLGSDRFTIFKSTNSGTTFFPSLKYKDSTYIIAEADPLVIFDSLVFIYYNIHDKNLYKSKDGGKTFYVNIKSNLDDSLNPSQIFSSLLEDQRNYINIDENNFLYTVSSPFLFDFNEYNYKTFNYFTTDKGDSWNFKILKDGFCALNYSLLEDKIIYGGFFVDTSKSKELGYIEPTAGILYVENNNTIIEQKFNSSRNVLNVKYLNQKIGYALVQDLEYRNHIYYTDNGGEEWIKLTTTIDTIYYVTDMELFDNKLMFTISPALQNKNARILIIDLITNEVEEINIQQPPLINIGKFYLTKNYIYIVGSYFSDEILSRKKIYRIARNSINTSVESEIETQNIATIWLSSSSSNPFSSQTEFTATWLPNTDLSTVTIKVYDLNGYEVADLSNQLIRNQFSSNQSKIEFTPSNIPTGIYLPVISDGTFKKSISVIYVK